MRKTEVKLDVKMGDEILTEEQYRLLIQRYTKIILDHMIYESDIAFHEIDEKLQWESLDWLSYAEDHYPNKLCVSDLDNIVILTKIFSKYFEYAVMNREYSKWPEKFEDFAIEVFLRECYILSIIEYTRQYSEKFNHKELFEFTLKYFDENIYSAFENLSGHSSFYKKTTNIEARYSREL